MLDINALFDKSDLNTRSPRDFVDPEVWNISANTTVKYMMDINKLDLSDYEYDHSIPVESNEQLNELELFLRMEIGLSMYRLDHKCAFRSQFEPMVARKIRETVDRIFNRIGGENRKYGQVFNWARTNDIPKYFPNWTNASARMLTNCWGLSEPECCYINDSIRKNDTSPLKSKKRRNKKWRRAKNNK